ncbi:hypothetical protein, partial [Helicobacter trogontum]|uniref:hypothetical protein n=1 Tax=Helicobacter trogontum TaxID=50960 RepID=UPI0034E88C66
MAEKSSIVKHIDDLADGVWDSVVVTAYGFSEFLYKISGLKDFIFNSDDKEQQEAIEEFKVFVNSLKLIKNNSTIRNIVINQIIQDAKDRPLYYAGSLIGPSAIASLIKNTGARVAYSSGVFIQKGFNASNKYSYPSFKTLQNNICSLYSNNKNYTNLFNQDVIMCSFLQNENQEYKTQSLQQEMQRLYHNIQKTNTEFNSYKPIPVVSFTNSKIAYIQKINPKDIESLTPNSPLHLLKALFFCEDYVLLDSNKEPLLNESNWREFYNYKSDFYTLFIADKQTLTQDYINERISLYKAIMQVRKQIQEKEIQKLQKQQQELEQTLQGLDSKQRETRLQELQREHARKQREKERQEQQEARFSKGNTQNLANTYTTNNNAYVTKDSYLVLESNNKDTKIIFLDSLKDSQSHIHSFTNFQDSNNSYLAHTSLGFTHLILQDNSKITIFAKDNSIIDSKHLEKDLGLDFNLPCDVYFYSLALRGGKEDMNNPRYFYGENGEVYIS